MGLNVIEITLKYLSLSTYPVQTDGFPVMPGHADLAVATSPTGTIFIGIESFDYHFLTPLLA